jgi:Methyltransferase domain
MADKQGEFSGDYSRHQSRFATISTKLAVHVRKQMFASLMAQARPSRDTKVLDVGVTSEDREGTNFLEAQYPYPNRITATGLEDASYLETKYPGVTFVQADGKRLPFEDKSFDLVVASAVIEHVGSRSEQRDFVRELSRVGRVVCLTTPNRYFPLEFHTMMPLVHWLPPSVFRAILRRVGIDFYASEGNLNLLSEHELVALAPPGTTATVEKFRLAGWTSNLMLHIQA